MQGVPSRCRIANAEWGAVIRSPLFLPALSGTRVRGTGLVASGYGVATGAPASTSDW